MYLLHSTRRDKGRVRQMLQESVERPFTAMSVYYVVYIGSAVAFIVYLGAVQNVIFLLYSLFMFPHHHTWYAGHHVACRHSCVTQAGFKKYGSLQ